MTERKAPIDQALDLFFYAPLGLLLNADELIPQLVERGRKQVQTARLMGPFALRQAQVKVGKVVGKAQERLTDLTVHDVAARERAASPAAASGGAAAATTTAPVLDERRVTPRASDALAIPDYDSLSASQVVPRLAGLSVAELEAVRTYETATRGRKTILNKVAQLQVS